MHHQTLERWRHSHTFGQEQKRPGEARTIIVILITGAMMVVEIVAGIVFGSMALLADGLHMGSHAVALGIAAFAYIYARRHAHDDRYSFGTGKVNALGGFTGAVLLAVFAVAMAWESGERLLFPVPIAFNQAIFVAVLGLIVNGASVLILGHEDHEDGHRHHHEHHDRGGDHAHDHGHHHRHHHDHNLRAAYFHVLADALTSLLAIIALLAAKYFGAVWMDPVMGIVGAALVARWSLGLMRASSAVLLDRQGPPHIVEAVRESLEGLDGNRVADLHLWSIGPQIYAAEVTIVTHEPKAATHYRSLIPSHLGIRHISIEVHACEADRERRTQESASIDH